MSILELLVLRQNLAFITGLLQLKLKSCSSCQKVYNNRLNNRSSQCLAFTSFNLCVNFNLCHEVCNKK